MFLLIATVAAVGRTMLSFVIAILLAVPAVWFQYHGIVWNDVLRSSRSRGCSAGRCTSSPRPTCCATCSSREVMTADKLFGAAAAYLMLGVLWAYIYVDRRLLLSRTRSWSSGSPGRSSIADALYLSITVLTSTGFGDITPLTRQARGVCMVEQITGALFVAILIARLAGVYPPRGSGVTSEASE